MFLLHLCLALLFLLVIFVVCVILGQYRRPRIGKEQNKPAEKKECPQCGQDSGILDPGSGTYAVIPHICERKS